MNILNNKFIIYNIDLPSIINLNVYNNDFTINDAKLVKYLLDDTIKVPVFLNCFKNYKDEHNSFLEKIKIKNKNNLPVVYENLNAREL